MNKKFEVSVEEEIKQVSMKRPHVVVLGAGASRATCPNGDRAGRILPLMTDFVDVVGLKALLQGWGIDPSRNFETIFTELYNGQEQNKVEIVENTIDAYFENLALPDEPTVYDHLVLSLRGKDLIATFNWDPLLIQAYLRNGQSGLGLPHLAFLHGNVRVGYCEKDRVGGPFGERCRHCGEPYKRPPLLYPIEKKDYGTNVFIADAWKQLRRGLQNAFMITIFGYSGPSTDEEALSAMRAAWGDKNQREMEQPEFIVAPTQNEDEVAENWDPFIHTDHYEIHKSFYHSWIAKHPRRTGEAYSNQYLKAKFIEDNPVPIGFSFPDVWKWYQQFKEPEQK